MSTIAALLIHSLRARALDYYSIQNNLRILARGMSAMHPGVVAELMRTLLATQPFNCNCVRLCNLTVKRYEYHFLFSKRSGVLG